MRIIVLGLGYVGTVSAACLTELGHEVVGVDPQEDKVNQINSGASPIAETGLDDLIKGASAKGVLRAQTTINEELMQWANASLICVGTPSRKNGSLDTRYAEDVVRTLGRNLKGSSHKHTVIVRSTLLPGSTNKILLPILEEALGRKIGDGLHLVYNPEFLRESSAVKDFWNPAFTIIGSSDDAGSQVVQEIYGSIEAPMVCLNIEEAEMIKYTCNVFHAMKITFANEIGNFAKEHGVDGRRVMEVICKDVKLNLSPYYMRPGYAYGGSCLPKDLRAMLSAAKSQDLSLPLLESLSGSNALQTQRGIDLVLAKKKRKVSILGISFKSGTDDLRESPIVTLVEGILGKGCDIKIYDANVQWSRLVGSNKSFVDAVIPHLAALLTDSLDEVIEHGDVIVIGNSAKEFAGALAKGIRDDQSIVDLSGLSGLDPEWYAALGDRYQGVCW